MQVGPTNLRDLRRTQWTVGPNRQTTFEVISCGALLSCADLLEKILSQGGHVLHRIDNKLAILLDHAKRNERAKKRRAAKAKAKRRAKR